MGNSRVNCLYCGEVIRTGRSDKKFCDSGCKDAHYNAIKSDEQTEISKIDAILKRNRRALKKLYDPGNPSRLFKREELIRAGYEFGFLTHVVVTRLKKGEIVFCYDFGLREEEDQCYRLFPSYSNVQVKDGYRFRVK
jgi:hypothetical protein